jgi:NhaP-type Na+/H+ or K+/H+ antiporter
MEKDSYSGGWFSPIGNFMLEFFGSVLLGFLIGMLCAVVLILINDHNLKDP